MVGTCEGVFRKEGESVRERKRKKERIERIERERIERG